ncbi:MAG TPA: Scr1 family TA system antitoxin-like transcriptional regulator, partial [Streptomyces sp.]|nr:Scr1 family TA system antitoxin-like transcriptional regulator [Streptomyces sp.]
MAARPVRQRLLAERGNTTSSLIIEQALLERRLGGADVTRALLGSLLVQGPRRHAEIRVMPLRQEDHYGFDGPMHLAETVDNRWAGYHRLRGRLAPLVPGTAGGAADDRRPANAVGARADAGSHLDQHQAVTTGKEGAAGGGTAVRRCCPRPGRGGVRGLTHRRRRAASVRRE